MNRPSTPKPDTPDLPPEDADHRMLDALLSVAGESAEHRNARIERVMQAVTDPQQNSPPRGVSMHIRPLSWLGTAALVATILITMWVILPGQAVETAHAAMVRVAETLQAVEHRRYDVTVLTTDGKRLIGTVDVAQGNRFLSKFKSSEFLGYTFEVIAGFDGKRYWMITPHGQVMTSDKPFGALFPVTREGDDPNAELFTLPRALATLQEGYDVVYADVEDPELMRLLATRNPDQANVNKINPALLSADVIARRDSGEVVRATFLLDQQFVGGNLSIRSITSTLQPDVQEPNLEWYEHQTHHTEKPLLK